MWCELFNRYAVASPLHQKETIRQAIEGLFGIPTLSLPNFLSITLTPSNQIIHPGRIWGVFKDWDGKSPFNEKDVPLIYEDMDDISADAMQYLDDEIQLIKVWFGSNRILYYGLNYSLYFFTWILMILYCLVTNKLIKNFVCVCVCFFLIILIKN